MGSSSIPDRGNLIVLPIRHNLKRDEQKKELSRLRSELRIVDHAIAALERLAATRFPRAGSRGRQAGGRA